MLAALLAFLAGLVLGGAGMLFARRTATPIATAAPSPDAVPPDDPARRFAVARHDVRNALSPVMLTGDRLLLSQEPSVARAGETIIGAVERIQKILDATRDPPAAP